METKSARTAQEAEDAKIAFQEQAKELNIQIGHKHGRSDPTNDFQGDDVMGDVAAAMRAAGWQGAEDEAGVWQQQRKKGRRPPQPSQPTPAAATTQPHTEQPSEGQETPAIPSATGQASEEPIGPLATAPRGRAADRDRTPRRARAAGTPAASAETGTLASGGREESGIPPGTAQPSDGAITPAVSSSISPLSSRAASPAGQATPSATGPPLEENPGGSEQPNERGGASATT